MSDVNVATRGIKERSDSQKEIDYFGGCPECGQNDGYFNVGRDHFFRCDAHKTCWCVGANLFSSWRYEDEATWGDNARRYSDYMRVEPIQGAPCEPDSEGAQDIPF